MPKISVIIPVYNVEKYLRRCLDSVLNQTFSDWDVICVNDGSPDNSAEILSEYAANDPRFIVITKTNGGLSDARNVGMMHATGDYILYLDSDDFIHPQTMEITYKLAKRDNADMVSYTYDRKYRPQLMARHVLGKSTDDIVPGGLSKKYDISKLKTLTTDNIFEFATEKTHNPFDKDRKWKVKHCQVWKNLYKRELISDLVFIKGILFEDMPWWSAVMLRRPRTVITGLPLYFYVPNFGGIVLSAKQLRIMECLSIGLIHAYKLYREKADGYQMKAWSNQFMWQFIIWTFRKIKYLKTKEEIAIAKKYFSQMRDIGMLTTPTFSRAKKYKKRIINFLDN